MVSQPLQETTERGRLPGDDDEAGGIIRSDHEITGDHRGGSACRHQEYVMGAVCGYTVARQPRLPVGVLGLEAL
jgi:hypothetical protein